MRGALPYARAVGVAAASGGGAAYLMMNGHSVLMGCLGGLLAVGTALWALATDRALLALPLLLAAPVLVVGGGIIDADKRCGGPCYR